MAVERNGNRFERQHRNEQKVNREEEEMPVITVEASRFTLEKKRELAKALTKTAAELCIFLSRDIPC